MRTGISSKAYWVNPIALLVCYIYIARTNSQFSSSELDSVIPPAANTAEWPFGLGPRDRRPLRTMFSAFRSASTIFAFFASNLSDS